MAAAPAPAREWALASPPGDGVSQVAWADARQLLVASWDGTVALHDVHANTKLRSYAHKGAVLCVAAGSGGGTAFSGGLDMAVVMHDFASGASTVLGSHTAAVRCMEHAPAHGLALSGSWDRSVKAWDPRGAPGAAAASLALPDRCYAMALAGPDTLVCASASRNVHMYDLRKLGGEPLAQARESSLKHQTRALRAFPDGAGFATGSIEGRVAIDFVSPAQEAQDRKYAFKCHRQKPAAPGGEERVFPVNALAFHPVHGTFATGGGDHLVAIWDWQLKKRLAQLHDYGAPITSLAFSPDGSLLAIAASYDWTQGDPAALPVKPPADAVYVRQVADAEVRPKARAAPAGA